MMKNITFAFNRSLAILFSISFIIVVISLVPYTINYFQENELVENIQVIIVMLAALLSFIGYKNKKNEPQIRQLFLMIAFVLFCLAGRELSWGRVFYLVSDDGNHQRYISLKELKWIRVLRYIITFIAFYFVFCFIKNKLYKTAINLFFRMRIYFWHIFLLVFSSIVAIVAERHFHNEPIEEAFETIFYITILEMLRRYSFNRKNDLNQR